MVFEVCGGSEIFKNCEKKRPCAQSGENIRSKTPLGRSSAALGGFSFQKGSPKGVTKSDFFGLFVDLVPKWRQDLPRLPFFTISMDF